MSSFLHIALGAVIGGFIIMFILCYVQIKRLDNITLEIPFEDTEPPEQPK